MLSGHHLAYCEATISTSVFRNCYHKLAQFIRFDNIETREEIIENNKFTPIRDLFGIFLL